MYQYTRSDVILMNWQIDRICYAFMKKAPLKEAFHYIISAI